MLKNLEVLISCSEKSSGITTSFESFSELVSSSLEIPNESIPNEKFSLNELEEPLNIFSALRCDNYNISYSGKCAKIV